ncbi:uncharacterized protein ColSpa_06179 [Colletotrichum spaethianum]|uniref:Uncharacterized protein n=1 Tax=Colletotrichum spaethianum TaxID=700344 RepID=A0AA37P277_9PEZI|nr:uncharacterized protein ColSpa_06179 [Colletotrichum spaethianum]GKT45998.1 hypothetical protein ColSpa_06179 [Colletotrichum spaethianum]
MAPSNSEQIYRAAFDRDRDRAAIDRNDSAAENRRTQEGANQGASTSWTQPLRDTLADQGKMEDRGRSIVASYNTRSEEAQASAARRQAEASRPNPAM